MEYLIDNLRPRPRTVSISSMEKKVNDGGGLYWRATLDGRTIRHYTHWHGDNPSQWVEVFFLPEKARERWKELLPPLSPAEDFDRSGWPHEWLVARDRR